MPFRTHIDSGGTVPLWTDGSATWAKYCCLDDGLAYHQLQRGIGSYVRDVSPKSSIKALRYARMLAKIAGRTMSLGLSPKGIRNARDYVSDYRRFEKLGGGITHVLPILGEYKSNAGITRGHYFHQDLLIASLVFEFKPDRHIDIGSRVDGFVAHVASFRRIEVMDIRELGSTGHPNISFLRADLMDGEGIPEGITDSISCLHAIEHFGLGRYGDAIDPDGHLRGFNNILKMLKVNGLLFVSFPISSSYEVHFNAHRVFHPADIFDWPHEGSVLELVRFDFVDDFGDLHRNVEISSIPHKIIHSCGIYTFRKLA